MSVMKQIQQIKDDLIYYRVKDKKERKRLLDILHRFNIKLK
jgi:hypothetical protein